MNNLSRLLQRVSALDSELGKELSAEVTDLSHRRSFGLVWENHNPEAHTNYTCRVRIGDMVGILPPRGTKIELDKRFRVVDTKTVRGTQYVLLETEDTRMPAGFQYASDVVVFNDADMPIYPGLQETGEVIGCDEDKPYHSVITAENYDALRMMQFTHYGALDAIYIDPPYNTGSRDWKYNNDYVSATDSFRGSKWLSMMESRLLLAKNLMNPKKSVLILTIDEKEYLNIGMLLRQVFPEAKIQMISSVINRGGSSRPSQFSRTDEYIYCVQLGDMSPQPLPLTDEWKVGNKKINNTLFWQQLRRKGRTSFRDNSPGCFYPIFINPDLSIHSIGEVLPRGVKRSTVEAPDDSIAVWPITSEGHEGHWQMTPGNAKKLVEQGFLKVNSATVSGLYYIKAGEQKKVHNGTYTVIGHREHDGSIITETSGVPQFVPGTQWRITSHNASEYGSVLLSKFLPDRKFPYPKSLYAVEDVLKFYVSDNPEAKILDFFGGSGTTLHAVMRLNKEDNGNRQCILVSNNEVSDDEAKKLTQDNLRPGDPEWEKYGICDYITKPRIRAAVTGVDSTGQSIKGNYTFGREFPMSDGFNENVKFFTLSYEHLYGVDSGNVGHRMNTLLCLYAGGVGEVLDVSKCGYAVNNHYGVLVDMSQMNQFMDSVKQHNPHIICVHTSVQSIMSTITKAFPDITAVNTLDEYVRMFDKKWTM